MAKRFILAQFNQGQNKIILSPSELRVRQGDSVVWISRLDDGDTYMAGDFIGDGKLFPQDEYTMPGVGESEKAEVLVAGLGAWMYSCSEQSSAQATGDSEPGQGIIIVDPPPIGDDEERGPGAREETAANVR